MRHAAGDAAGLGLDALIGDDETSGAAEQASRGAAGAPAAKPARSRHLVHPKVALATAALHAAADGRLRRRLRRGGPLAIIVEVPGGDWVPPVREAVGALLPALAHDASRNRSGRKVPSDQTEEIAEALTLGPAFVVAVSAQDVPPILAAVVDIRIRLRVDGRVVRDAMRRCLRGRLPRAVPDDLIAGLSFHDILSCLRMGETPLRAMARLRRLGEPLAESQSLPALADAVVYGPARAWGLDLARDLADWRAGRIPFSAVDRGAVLYGPPGTGKTMFARILARTCGVPLVASSVGELFAVSSGDLGAVIRAARAVFDRAHAAAPCILFLDELDALPSRDRMSDRGRDWWTPVITDFLTQIDGAVGGREGLVVVAATNRIQDIEPALMRPGRLERAIEIPAPEPEGLAWVLRHHMGADIAAPDDAVLRLAQAARGATPADAMGWVRAARRRARREGRAPTFADIESEVSPSDPRSPADIRRAAIHEAGHAVAAVRLGLGTVRSISLVSFGFAVGSVAIERRPMSVLRRADIEADVVGLLAGRAAEIVLLGCPSAGAGGAAESDLGRATDALVRLHGTFGLGDTLAYRSDIEAAGAAVLDPALLRAVEADLQRLQEAAEALVRAHRATIEALADALVRHRVLGADEIARLVHGGGRRIRRGKRP
ncbi:AAA family ATPase [Blastochloris tepida]|uniref:AAA family ATPase n=1 Tax=Blastochloris tepida TaxID=2233851 RepID=UPI000F816FD5|nr:AAA family ATPase [Blastochloris tepida]